MVKQLDSNYEEKAKSGRTLPILLDVGVSYMLYLV